MNKQYNSLTQCTVEFLHWVVQVILKLFCLTLGPYSFTKFLHYNQKDLWLAPFLQVKNSVANSAGGSFCWNYATDTFYSNYAGVNVLLLLCRFWGSVAIMLVILSATLMLVDLFVAIMQVTVSVAIMQLEVSAAHMQVTVSAANMWVTIFIVIMQMGVSVAIMQVVFSAVHYAHDYFYCNYAGDCFCCSYVSDSFK